MDLNSQDILKFLSSLTWQGLAGLWVWTVTIIVATYKVMKHIQPVIHTDKAECEIFRDFLNSKGMALYDKLQLTRHNKQAVHINCPLFQGKDGCMKIDGGKCKYFTA
ncbi:MAG: hypothetical protein A2023_07275 [Sulfuricurvum sp. GWF2_44_89]|uniref:Uncharacterized protein n=1 Tax=Sulfuricurvum kujiense TaxID=148813 RepID=A0A2D3WMC8_9BACT|nr:MULTISPECIES: hypothetical protein [Sulfuricurvum]OHD78277.1 MAG: hypothetical protein A2023_07275 [Sulfuricurvum sp. GWF2_44_89]OHD91584.1 MAG: hypothetical protein A2517_07215 [Sulfuricurvum sp. RIFOXYD12_FULL_44_77]OHD94127.1 MAG: hypothetical protein A2552_01645 [Sulfuricurvum sp. RIFOXYD2_FULL_44_160]DAB38864.1 MAG TPA: hypothetical protein CFH83_03890 [Sulfuricurvum kujiense]